MDVMMLRARLAPPLAFQRSQSSVGAEYDGPDAFITWYLPGVRSDVQRGLSESPGAASHGPGHAPQRR